MSASTRQSREIEQDEMSDERFIREERVRQP